MSNAVAAAGLTKRFGKVLALDDLTLDIPEGSIFGVIGPNGAGKTTLVRLLVDILRPTSGHVEVLGLDPRVGGPALRARVGYLPGEFHSSSRLSGIAHLRFWASLSPRNGTLQRAREFAERLHLDLSRPAGKLSKGNRQKLGVIQAFMHRPDLLILDEPTSGLDPLVQQAFLQMVRDARDDGATVFLSSHILSEVEQVADEAAILRAGRVVRQAPITELHETAVRRLRAVIRAPSLADVEASAERRGLELDVEAGGDGQVRIAGLVEGRADEVVALLAGFKVVDLVFAEPDLEETVLDIYSAGSQAP